MPAGRAALGLAASVPVAAVFGGLLMHADPVFDRLVTRLFDLDLAPLLSHLAAVVLWGWVAGGLLRVLATPAGEPFGTGALLAGWLVLAGLNLANPDAVIAGVNLDRAARGQSLDAAYAAALSADALPRLQRRLATLGSADVCGTAQALDDRWRGELGTARRWTIALARAPRGMFACGASSGD